MKKRLICLFIPIIIFIYTVATYNKLTFLLNEVANSNNNLSIAIERQKEVMTKYSMTLNEIAIYNLSMNTNKKYLIDLNKNLERYEVELVGSVNRISISKTRLSKSITNYNYCVSKLSNFIVVIIFKFKVMDTLSLNAKYADYQLCLTRKE